MTRPWREVSGRDLTIDGHSLIVFNCVGYSAMKFWQQFGGLARILFDGIKGRGSSKVGGVDGAECDTRDGNQGR